VGESEIRPPRQVRQQDQMPGTRNRQEFRQALQHCYRDELNQQGSTIRGTGVLQAMPVVAQMKTPEFGIASLS